MLSADEVYLLCSALEDDIMQKRFPKHKRVSQYSGVIGFLRSYSILWMMTVVAGMARIRRGKAVGWCDGVCSTFSFSSLVVMISSDTRVDTRVHFNSDWYYQGVMLR